MEGVKKDYSKDFLRSKTRTNSQAHFRAGTGPLISLNSRPTYTSTRTNSYGVPKNDQYEKYDRYENHNQKSVTHSNISLDRDRERENYNQNSYTQNNSYQNSGAISKRENSQYNLCDNSGQNSNFNNFNSHPQNIPDNKNINIRMKINNINFKNTNEFFRRHIDSMKTNRECDRLNKTSERYSATNNNYDNFENLEDENEGSMCDREIPTNEENIGGVIKKIKNELDEISKHIRNSEEKLETIKGDNKSNARIMENSNINSTLNSNRVFSNPNPKPILNQNFNRKTESNYQVNQQDENSMYSNKINKSPVRVKIQQSMISKRESKSSGNLILDNLKNKNKMLEQELNSLKGKFMDIKMNTEINSKENLNNYSNDINYTYTNPQSNSNIQKRRFQGVENDTYELEGENYVKSNPIGSNTTFTENSRYTTNPHFIQMTNTTNLATQSVPPQDNLDLDLLSTYKEKVIKLEKIIFELKEVNKSKHKEMSSIIKNYSRYLPEDLNEINYEVSHSYTNNYSNSDSKFYLLTNKNNLKSYFILEDDLIDFNFNLNSNKIMQLDQIEIKYETMKSEFEKMQLQAADSNDHLIEELRLKEEKFNEAKEEFEKINQKSKQMVDSVNRLKKLNNDLNINNRELKLELDEKSEILLTCESKFKDINDKLEFYIEEYNKIKESNKILMEEKKSEDKDILIDELKEKLLSIEENYKSCLENSNNLIKEKSKLNQKLQQYEISLEDCKKQIILLDNENLNLKQLTEENKELFTKINCDINDIEKYKEDLLRSEEKKNSLIEKNEKLLEEINILHKQIDNIPNIINEELEKYKGGLNRTLQDNVDHKIKKVKDKLDLALNEKRILEENINTLSEENSKLSEKNRDMLRDLVKYDSSYKELERKYFSQEEKLNEKLDNIEMLTKQNLKLKETIEEEKINQAEYYKNKPLMDNSIKELKSEIKRIKHIQKVQLEESIIKSNKDKIFEVSPVSEINFSGNLIKEKEISELMDKIINLTEKLQKRETEEKINKEKNNSHALQFDELNKKITILEGENFNFKNEIEKMKVEKIRLDNLISSKEELNNENKSCIDELSKEREIKDKTILGLENEITQLNEKFKNKIISQEQKEKSLEDSLLIKRKEIDDLKKLLKEKENSDSLLINDINYYKQQFGNLENEIKINQGLLNQKESTERNLLADLEKIKEENDIRIDNGIKLAEEVLNLKNQINQLNSVISKLHEELERKEDENSKNSNHISDLSIKLHNTKENLKNKDEIINQLTDQITEKEKSILQQKNKILEITAKNEKLKDEVNSYNEKDKSILQKKIDELSDIKEKLTNQIIEQKSELEIRLDDLSKNNVNLKDELSKLKIIENESEIEIKNLKNTNSELDKLNKEIIKKLESNELITNELNSKNQTLFSQNENSMNEIEIKINLIKELETQINLHLTKLSEENSIIRQKDYKLAESEEALSHMDKKIKELQEKLFQSSNTIKNLEEKNSEVLKDIGELNKKLTENSSKFNDKERQDEELLQKLNLLQEKILHYENKITNLESLISDKNTLIANIEKESRINSEKISKLDETHLDDIKKIENQQNQIISYIVEIEKLSKELLSLKNQLRENESKISNLELSLKDKIQETQLLQDKIFSLEKEILENQIINQDTEVKIEKLTEENFDLNKSILNLKEEISKLKSENKNLLEEISPNNKKENNLLKSSYDNCNNNFLRVSNNFEVNFTNSSIIPDEIQMKNIELEIIKDELNKKDNDLLRFKEDMINMELHLSELTETLKIKEKDIENYIKINDKLMEKINSYKTQSVAENTITMSTPIKEKTNHSVNELNDDILDELQNYKFQVDNLKEILIEREEELKRINKENENFKIEIEKMLKTVEPGDNISVRSKLSGGSFILEDETKTREKLEKYREVINNLKSDNQTLLSQMGLLKAEIKNYQDRYSYLLTFDGRLDNYESFKTNVFKIFENSKPKNKETEELVKSIKSHLSIDTTLTTGNEFTQNGQLDSKGSKKEGFFSGLFSSNKKKK